MKRDINIVDKLKIKGDRRISTKIQLTEGWMAFKIKDSNIIERYDIESNKINSWNLETDNQT